MNLSASRSSVQGAQPDVDPTALQRGVADGPHSCVGALRHRNKPSGKTVLSHDWLSGGSSARTGARYRLSFCSGCPFQRSCSISQARLVGGWVTWLFYTTRARVYTRQVE